MTRLDEQEVASQQKKISTTTTTATTTTTTTTTSPPLPLVDNSAHTYVSTRLSSSGMRAFCQRQVLTTCPEILRDLNNDIEDCLEILPKSVHTLIRHQTHLWINHTYKMGPLNAPRHLNHATTHHHEAWLLQHRDNPKKAGGIEIYNCFDYQRMKWHWNGCGLILHELCHVLHQNCLGLDNVHVNDAFRQANESGLYEQVLRRDWAGKVVDCDVAYCMVDHREFFAEMSVAYLCQHYASLDNARHSRMELASPPLTSPQVCARIVKAGYGQDHLAGLLPSPRPPGLRGSKKRPMPCNKFYPFTNGQLKTYDPATFASLERLWQEISNWRDPNNQAGCLRACWNPLSRQHCNAVVPAFTDTVNI